MFTFCELLKRHTPDFGMKAWQSVPGGSGISVGAMVGVVVAGVGSVSKVVMVVGSVLISGVVSTGVVENGSVLLPDTP